MVDVPQHPDGMRRLPPVSLPVAAGTMRAASAAALPPDEPPGMCVGSHGFPVWGVAEPAANSCVWVWPRSTIPAAFSRAHTVLSPVATLTGNCPEDPSSTRLEAV